MKEKLDLRFLGYSLGALALLSAGWFGVHAFQMTRHGSTLLDLASQAEAQWKPDGGKLEREKFDRALRFLGQYVKLVPTDIDARVRYGELFEKKDKLPATKVNAMAVYEQVLLRDPERVEIRRRIAKLAVDVKDFALAHTHLEGLEEDAEIKSLLAQCFAAEKDYTKAAKYFEESIDGDPHRVENYVLLAEILRVRLDQRDEADNTMKELLVKNNPTSSKAYLERAKYQQRYPQASDAQGAKSATGIAKAPRQVPEEVVRQLATAEIARDKGDLAGARDVLQHAVKLHPKEVPLYQAEASLELAAKRPKEALESLRRGLREVEVPNRPDLIFGLAQLLIQQGEDKEAQAAIKQLRDLKLLVEADIAEARRLAPKEVASLLELETAAKMEGDLAGARDLRQQARTLEAPPLLATVEIARDKGDLAGARDVLQQALALDPKNVKLYQAGADLESAANRPEKALESLQRGLEKLSEQPDLIFGQALLKIQLGWDEDDVKKTIKQLRGLKLPFFYADYLNALLKFRERDWDAASAKLENIRPLLVEVPELAAPADGLLVQCYEQLGNVEGQLSVYRRVGSADPFNITARLGTVSTLFKLGRIEEAIEENQRLLQLPSAPASAWTSLARLRFLQTSRLGTPNWESVEQTLDQVAQKVPEAVDVPILKAEIRAARGEPDEARQDLETALKKQPKRIELWVAVVDHEDHEKKWLQAQKTLERAEQELGDGVDLRLAKARHLFRRGGEVTDPAFQKLTASLDTLDAKDQARLLKGLVEICVQFNHADEALRLGSQLTEPDLRARLFLFDAALQAGDEAQMEEQLAAILGIEGVQGPFWNVCEASYLIWKFKNERPKDPDEARAYLVAARAYLVKARACLSAAAKRRPAWGRIYLKLGEIDELESKEDQDPAIRNYMRAIELGEQEFAFISHLLQLLYKDQRYNDAELVIAKLPSQTPVSAELQGMILEISRQTQDYTLALDAARKAVAKDSKNYRDFIWLGQILLGQIRWIGHQKEEAKQVLKEEALKKEAEHVLRRAVQLAENEPDPWVALVQFLASTNKVEAEETLLQAEGKLDQKKYVLAFAECYEAVGRLGKAGELFDAAVNAEPTNFAVLRGAANYHLRQANYHLRQGYLKKAKNELNRIISLENESPQKTAWAKRVLAVVLAQGDYQERQHALAILDGGPQPDKVEDVRARALVLAAQPSRDHKKKACELLEDLNRSQPLSSEDQFLLVQLYDTRGDKASEVDELMHQLLTHNGDERRYLIYYVQNLLRRGEVHTAEFWLDRLEQVDRQAALRDHLEQVDRQAFRTIALKAQLLKARGKSEEVVPLLNKYIGQSTGTPVMLGALLLEELGQKAAAEEMFQRFVADPKEPQGILELARFLGRQKRLPKALDQCESAWKTCPAEAVARACSAVLHAAPANQDQFLRVQRWLDAAIDKAPAVAGLKICLADLHDLRGNYQEAETVYGQVLALNNRNAEALNNLAWLLIYQDRNGLKALELINRAIEILGPVPELLDTRAGAYLALGKSEPAVAELQNALDLPGTKGTVVAVILFHLAQAQKQCGNDDACRKAMAEAKKAGLVRELVHPLEQAEFDKLSGELVGQK